jgi:hypothetical protein
MEANDIANAVQSATKTWKKQRETEYKRTRSAASRKTMYVSTRVNFTDVADDILPDAYEPASGNGRYSLKTRQFYYAAREEFRKITRREIGAQYFSNTLLVQYTNQNPSKTAHWKITSDPRGTLIVPNAGHEVKVPCGTLELKRHREKANKDINPYGFNESLEKINAEWPSLVENQRYQGVLYIEKEGFTPLLEEANRRALRPGGYNRQGTKRCRNAPLCR